MYWLIMFVVCYIVVEYGQNYLYDETTPHVAWKVAGGSLIVAALLVKTRSSYDTMFTSEIPWTVVQGIVWFAVFTLVFRFQPQHGAAIGVVTMLLVTGLATMAIDSFTQPASRGTPPRVIQSKPVRQPATSAMPLPTTAPKEEPKAK
jgi:peptidoglycan/LPS O-acetylase OafA/YrhL